MLKINIFFTIVLISFGTFSHGDLDELIQHVTNKILKHPDSAELYLSRAKFYRLHKKFEQAQDDVEKAKKLNSNIETRLIQAEIFLDQDSVIIASKLCEELIKDYPNSSDLYRIRSKTHEKKREFKSAISDLKKVLSLRLNIRPIDIYHLIDLHHIATPDWIDSAFSILDTGRIILGHLIVFDDYEFNLAKNQKKYGRALNVADNILTKLERKEFWLFEKAIIYKLQQNTKYEKRNLILCKDAINKLPISFQQNEGVKSLTKQVNNRLKALDMK